MTFDPVRDIEEFHKKFGLGYAGLPRSIPDDIQRFRILFLEEELGEYKSATLNLHWELGLERINQTKVREGLEDALDALVDLVYVALGTAHLHGFDFKEAWRRVHEANMKKVRAKTASDSQRGAEFDVVKPINWVAPNHADLVDKNLHATQK